MMPVYKYQTFEEAEQHLSKLISKDPIERIARLKEIADAIKPPTKIQKGVFFFKNIKEANQHRQNATEL